MDKSIENIWKEGFIKEGALVAPKLNDLYNTKSQHLVDRLLRTGRRNIIGIVIGAVIVFIGFALIQSWPAGLALMALLLWLAYYTYVQSKRLSGLDLGQNSYQYLQALDNTLQSMSATYARIYRVLYPLIMLLFGLGMIYSAQADRVWEKMIANYPDLSMTGGVPTNVLIGLLAFAVFFALVSGPLYRFDIAVIYGPILKKLQEMLADMKTLRA